MLRFEWDPAKAHSNERKHGVRFEDAMHVFEDPNARFEQDRSDETGELRWQALGRAGGVAVPLVAHTVREEGGREVIRLISVRRATRKERPVMKKLISKTLANSPMTAARKRRLAQLAAQPDSKIDLSDIPELKENFWKNAVRNPFYRPVKEQLTVRLDSDVVAWLRQQGKGYQTRLNQVLREVMLEDIRKSA
jgi:uncharacterized DUF497 family protein